MLTPDALLFFIDNLRRDGYNIGVAQQMACQDLLLALAAQGQWPQHSRRWKTLLAPILCGTPQEQAAFYERFDEWWKQMEPPPLPGPEPLPTPDKGWQKLARRTRPWRWILATTAFILLGIWAVLIFTPAPPRSQTLHGKIIAPDSAAVANATISFINQTAYSDAKGHFSFTHLRQDSLAHLLVQHENFDTTRHPVQLNRDDTSRVLVMLKRKLDQQKPPTISQPQDTTSGASRQSYEERKRQLQVIVSRINAFADQAAQPPDTFYRRYYPALRLGTLLLPLLLFTAWWAWQLYRRRLILEKRRTSATPDFQRLVVKGADGALFRGPAFRRTAQLLRLHREAGSSELNAPATVEATLQRGGLFAPVYQTRQLLPEYLVLIDRAGFHDQQARFVDEALARLRDDGVFIDRYYFDRDPRQCFRDDPFAPPLTIDELAMRHPEHRLMIFTDGAGLMHPLTGKPQGWLELFEAWGDRALLTPETPSHWGYREMALAGLDFLILPATQNGLNLLVETLQTDLPPNVAAGPFENDFPEMLAERPLLYLERRVPDGPALERLCNQLQVYLGDGGYLWLSACAIYPQLAWDLTLYLGGRLTDENNEKLITENRLLKLSRLPWLRHDLMPDWLRLRLIAGLNREQERTVRQALDDLLQSALDPTRDGFVLDIAKPMQVLKWRDWQRLFRDFLRTEPDHSRLRDYVFLGFMSGRKPSRLTVTVPNLLHRTFFRHGQTLLGLRPATLLFMTIFFAFVGWTIITITQPASLLPIPHFQMAAESDLRTSSNANLPYASSDSSLKYYLDVFVKQQMVTSSPLVSASIYKQDSASKYTILLYQSWLADTLAHVTFLDSNLFLFYTSKTFDSLRVNLDELKQPLYLTLNSGELNAKMQELTRRLRELLQDPINKLFEELTKRLNNYLTMRLQNFDEVYDDLKLYLLLDPERLRLQDSTNVRFIEYRSSQIFDDLLMQIGLNEDTQVLRTEFQSKVRALTKAGVKFPSGVQYNLQLVSEVRGYISSSMETLDNFYKRLLSIVNSQTSPLKLADVAGVRVVRSNYQLPGVYTKDGWNRMKAYIESGIEKLGPDWVLGEQKQQIAPELQNSRLIRQTLWEKYLKEYANNWWQFLESVQYVNFDNLFTATEYLGILSDPNGSPLVLLFQRVVEETRFQNQEVNDFVQTVHLNSVEQQFADLQEFAAGGSGNDSTGGLAFILGEFGKIRGKVQSIQSDPFQAKDYAAKLLQTQTDELTGAMRAIGEVTNVLTPRSRRLVRNLLEPPIIQAWKTIAASAQQYLNEQWQNVVHNEFKNTLAEYYPFKKDGMDAPISDFERFFQPQNGTLWTFYREELQPFLREGTWTPISWEGYVGVVFSRAVLEDFRYAEAIASELFKGGALQLQFTLEPRLPVVSGISPASQVCLTIDGQQDCYRMGLANPVLFTWPRNEGATSLVVDTQNGRFEVVKKISGQWGIFHLLEKAAIERMSSRDFEVSWQQSVGSAFIRVIYRLKAASAYNPFRSLQRNYFDFKFPAQLD